MKSSIGNQKYLGTTRVIFDRASRPSLCNTVFPQMAKKKIKRNITGLRNQPKAVPSVENKDAELSISNSSETQYVSHEQTDLDEEEKPRWDAPDTEDDIGSEHEQDFLDHDGKEEQRSGVNVRKYRKYGLYVAPMRTAIHAGDDLRDEEWVPRKKLRKEKKGVFYGSISLFEGLTSLQPVPRSIQRGQM